MAVAASGHIDFSSVDVLDFLFDNNDGILTQDSCFQQEEDILKLPDFGLDEFSADLCLNNLNVDFIDNVLLDSDPSTVNAADIHQCDAHYSDHMYSRSHSDSTSEGQGCVPSLSPPSVGSHASMYSASSGSPHASTTGMGNSSSASPAESCSSPLGDMTEDLSMQAVSAIVEPATMVVQADDVIHVVSGCDETVIDDDGLISVDIEETDIDSVSDGSGGDVSTLGETSFFDFGFTGCNTDSLPFTVHDTARTVTKKSQRLVLSAEEKSLLAKEGISLPTDLPLTREEERALKTVRRKIRNKVSAKVSRRKKQEYVEGLEKRVKVCTLQNKQLQQKVERLEKMNQSFLSQLKKLQAAVGVANAGIMRSVTVTARQAQTGTCIMVLLLSFAFFILPNVGPWFGSHHQMPALDQPAAAASRKLLQHEGINDRLAVDEQWTPAVDNPFLHTDHTSMKHETLATDSVWEEDEQLDSIMNHTLALSAATLQQPASSAGHNVVDIVDATADVTKLPSKNDL